MEPAMDDRTSTADCEVNRQDSVSFTSLSNDNTSIVQDYIIQDYTINTNSIVLTLTNYNKFQTVNDYFIGNFTWNSLKRQDGIIIKTVYSNLNVIITVYNKAQKIHLQGKGCKKWWEDVFIFTLNDLTMSSNCENPITSTPVHCSSDSMTDLKQIAVAEDQLANCDHSTIENALSVNNSLSQLQQSMMMQSSTDKSLEESNKINQQEISSRSEALIRAKNKLRLFINNSKSETSENSTIRKLQEENVMLKQRIAQMDNLLATNKADIKLLSQDNKNLLESLKQANTQCEEQVLTLNVLMNQISALNQKQTPKGAKNTKPKTNRQISITSSTIESHVEITDQIPEVIGPIPEVVTRQIRNIPEIEHNVKRDRTLLIGTSILKLVKTKGLSTKVDIKTNRGAIIPDIGHILLSMDLRKYDTIIIHAGGNDASQGEHISDIIYEYERLLNMISSRYPDIRVVISGLTARRDADVKIVNAALLDLCDHYGLCFIDNFSSILCHDKCVHRDGIHLTKYGTSLLLNNIDKVTPILKRNDVKHIESQFQNPVCFYCGESGHITRVCRHGSPVRCWHCGASGHKSKMCQQNTH